MNTETLPPDDSGIGPLLKKEREKKGISREYASRITRLRLHFIEALEEENWQALPEPVFIKGFIRSYAQFLGLNRNSAVALYEEKSGRVEEFPKPLVAVKKTAGIKIFLSLLLFAVIVFVLFFRFRPIGPVPAEIPGNLETQAETISLETAASEGESLGEPGTADQDNQETAAEEEPLPGQQNIVPEQPETIEIPSDVDETAAGITPAADDLSLPVALYSFQAEEQSPVINDMTAALQPGVPGADDAGLLTLDGIVNMRTYIKIYVDDLPAREYIFHPGSRPQWKARKGFDIRVGNAAGVEFVFNGKNEGNLGAPGKVVRARFPEDFESMLYEE